MTEPSLNWLRQGAHWFPTNDDIVHTLSRDCVCGPVDDYEASDMPWIIHNPLRKETPWQETTGHSEAGR